MGVNTKTSNSELEYFVLHADFSDTVSKVIKHEEEKKINKKYATAKVRNHAIVHLVSVFRISEATDSTTILM